MTGSSSAGQYELSDSRETNQENKLGTKTFLPVDTPLMGDPFSSLITFCQCRHADTNDHCRLTPRAIKLRSRLAVMKTNDATHNATSIARRYVAVGTDIPMPVARATYAATQTGHLGSSASVALGTIQLTIFPPRRNRDAGRRASSRS